MKLNLFPRTQRGADTKPLAESGGSKKTLPLAAALSDEQIKLVGVLHQLLQMLPQAYSGRESIKRMCQMILPASPHIRLVWVGFCQDDSGPTIKPTAVVGRAVGEVEHWHLANDCFDYATPFVQTVDWDAGLESDFHALFAPWQAHPETCTVKAALAIPLRSEKARMRGMMVFYADTEDYFSETGFASFQAFGHVGEVIWKQSNLSHLLTRQAQFDSLAGLLTRRRIAHVYDEAVATDESALSILYCRLDDFHKINDLYGWAVGDNILSAFAKDTAAQLRITDSGGRWHATDFLYVLPATDALDAKSLGDAFVNHFMHHPVNVENWSIRLTLSVGVATYGADGRGLDELIHYATQHLRGPSGAQDAEI
ncbi:GGDEF domain-containing protein [Collimonas sp.]|jgi:diguanylate cyclase (GGDEF)-like protein|uniref:GGDEF domain-containing protein n=1 Tax=Collimonas sp. TaxID=1963772 RepID=UPI0037BF4EA2